MKYSDCLAKMKPSASMKGLAEKEYLFNLAVGSPDIAPPPGVANLLKEFAASPVYNYQPVKGTQKALENLKLLVDAGNSETNPAENLILVPGAKYGIYLSLKTITNIGDSVLLIEPYWLSYPDICISLGLDFLTWQADGTSQHYTIERFLEIIRSKNQIKAVIINNPVNPSGYIFDNDLLNSIIKICYSEGIWVVLDEVYKELCFDSNIELHTNLNAVNLIKVGSLSKSLCIPGFRAGYVNASSAFIKKFNLLHQHIATSIHSLTNYIVSKVDADVYRAFARHCAGIYSERYQLARQILGKKEFRVAESRASFYIMVDVSSKFEDGEKASEFYEQQKLLVTPGINYGDGYSKYIRLCLTLPDNKLREAIEML